MSRAHSLPDSKLACGIPYCNNHDFLLRFIYMEDNRVVLHKELTKAFIGVCPGFSRRAAVRELLQRQYLRLDLTYQVQRGARSISITW